MYHYNFSDCLIDSQCQSINVDAHCSAKECKCNDGYYGDPYIEPGCVGKEIKLKNSIFKV